MLTSPSPSALNACRAALPLVCRRWWRLVQRTPDLGVMTAKSKWDGSLQHFSLDSLALSWHSWAAAQLASLRLHRKRYTAASLQLGFTSQISQSCDFIEDALHLLSPKTASLTRLELKRDRLEAAACSRLAAFTTLRHLELAAHSGGLNAAVVGTLERLTSLSLSGVAPGPSPLALTRLTSIRHLTLQGNDGAMFPAPAAFPLLRSYNYASRAAFQVGGCPVCS